MSTLRQISCGIVPLSLTSDGWKVLLILHKNSRSWGFPKGKLEEGEEAKECAIRELFEETGLSIERFLLESPFIEKYEFFHAGEKIEKSVYYFLAIVFGPITIQEEEVLEAEWLSLPTAIEKLSFEEARGICRKVEDFLNNSEGN